MQMIQKWKHFIEMFFIYIEREWHSKYERASKFWWEIMNLRSDIYIYHMSLFAAKLLTRENKTTQKKWQMVFTK